MADGRRLSFYDRPRNNKGEVRRRVFDVSCRICFAWLELWCADPNLLRTRQAGKAGRTHEERKSLARRSVKRVLFLSTQRGRCVRQSADVSVSKEEGNREGNSSEIGRSLQPADLTLRPTPNFTKLANKERELRGDARGPESTYKSISSPI